ncbi:thiol peroxidase [[Mycoplasma] mobile]|uniref:Thiol peroxidase n=1 Tax=Mycoplasma mobile (strain ATCC 43663 / 163K / NCTC 11711) TaxID=267748 RepID=Q6KI11_MYCM1|nr:thiol peroxidase [[Mycoplasma] mobile]AAT27765.1 thiol peroxidase [Mycoplasma mobile 163K]
MKRTVMFSDKEFELVGPQLKLGDKVTFKATSKTLESVTIDKLEKITVLTIFPSISTSICDVQTSEMSKIASEFTNFNFVAISLDLPFTLKEWCGTKNVKNIEVLSDYREREFGKKYGFLIDDLFLLSRGTIVLDKSNKVIYIEQLKQVKTQIDFEKLRNFLKTIK